MGEYVRAVMAASVGTGKSTRRRSRDETSRASSNYKEGGREMTKTAATMTDKMTDNLTLNINQEIRVRASLDTTFSALLEQMGPHNETPDGNPLPLKSDL